MNYDALDIANYIIYYLGLQNKYINNLALNFILYLIQKESLQILNKPMFRDDLICGKYGIKVNKVYEEYKINLDRKIYTIIKKPPLLDIESKNLIKKNADKYSDWNVFELRKFIKIPNGAWDQTLANNKTIIDLELIKNEI